MAVAEICFKWRVKPLDKCVLTAGPSAAAEPWHPAAREQGAGAGQGRGTWGSGSCFRRARSSPSWPAGLAAEGLLFLGEHVFGRCTRPSELQEAIGVAVT